MSEIDTRLAAFLKRMAPVKETLPLEEIAEKLMEMGFFTAPASACYHGNWEGGLFEHSMNVTNSLVELTDRMGLKWMRPESPYIVGMFHDLCKCDQYEREITGHDRNGDARYSEAWGYRNDMLLKGHGEKSVMLAATLTELTYEEVLCIMYHMGAFVPKEEWNNYTRAIHYFDNVLWTHTADMVAAHIKEVP